MHTETLNLNKPVLSTLCGLGGTVPMQYTFIYRFNNFQPYGKAPIKIFKPGLKCNIPFALSRDRAKPTICP